MPTLVGTMQSRQIDVAQLAHLATAGFREWRPQTFFTSAAAGVPAIRR